MVSSTLTPIVHGLRGNENISHLHKYQSINACCSLFRRPLNQDIDVIIMEENGESSTMLIQSCILGDLCYIGATHKNSVGIWDHF